MTDAIAGSLPLFFSPDDVFEVRVLDAGKPGRKLAGWFRARDIPARAAKIAEAAESAGGVYFTPQRLDPATYRRCANVLGIVRKGNPKLTHDIDVLARRYMLVDVDPVRATGHEKRCATDAEKEAAWDVAGKVRGCLASHRWPAPIVVDSGNGYHLYYRLAGELAGGSVESQSDSIAKLLRVLAGRFDSATAKIDTSVYNASRIMKVPGTWARKGHHSKDRPHRLSRVMEVPSDW